MHGPSTGRKKFFFIVRWWDRSSSHPRCFDPEETISSPRQCPVHYWQTPTDSKERKSYSYACFSSVLLVEINYQVMTDVFDVDFLSSKSADWQFPTLTNHRIAWTNPVERKHLKKEKTYRSYRGKKSCLTSMWKWKTATIWILFKDNSSSQSNKSSFLVVISPAFACVTGAFSFECRTWKSSMNAHETDR